jgi:hypothetical protein
VSCRRYRLRAALERHLVPAVSETRSRGASRLGGYSNQIATIQLKMAIRLQIIIVDREYEY